MRKKLEVPTAVGEVGVGGARDVLLWPSKTFGPEMARSLRESNDYARTQAGLSDYKSGSDDGYAKGLVAAGLGAAVVTILACIFGGGGAKNA